MKKISTTNELKAALEAGEKKIVCTGGVAEKFIKILKKKKRRKRAGIALAAIAGGILAAPLTGGTSLAATGMGLTGMGLTVGAATGTAAGLTIGTLTISATELAILCGTAIAGLAILKDKKVKTFINPDRSVTLEVE